MNFNSMHAFASFAGLAAACLLNGCARGHSKGAVYQPIQPAQPAREAQFIVQTNGSAPLGYQWYFNTNGESQRIGVGGGTNTLLLYQWYKNTNTNEGAQH